MQRKLIQVLFSFVATSHLMSISCPFPQQVVYTGITSAGLDIDELEGKDAEVIGNMLTKLQQAEIAVKAELEAGGVDLSDKRLSLDANEFSVYGDGVIDPRLLDIPWILLYYYNGLTGELGRQVHAHRLTTAVLSVWKLQVRDKRPLARA